jgi:hypothetical protein
MSEQKDNKTFAEDGTRPIASGEIKIAETFAEDGVRTIAESPDFLVKDNQIEQTDLPTTTDSLNADQVIEMDGKRPINNNEVEVVDTFEADGTRPIMSNKYQVVDTLNVDTLNVDTLNIDGTRPITSE